MVEVGKPCVRGTRYVVCIWWAYYVPVAVECPSQTAPPSAEGKGREARTEQHSGVALFLVVRVSC